LKGRRVYFDDPVEYQPGDYGKWRDSWWVYPPMEGGWGGYSIAKHTVIEHEDKTITVTPSILVTDGYSKNTWHGYLTRGVWSTC